MLEHESAVAKVLVRCCRALRYWRRYYCELMGDGVEAVASMLNGARKDPSRYVSVYKDRQFPKVGA